MLYNKGMIAKSNEKNFMLNKQGERMNKLTGNEPFLYKGAQINRQILDFWSWQSSELLSNTLRGALAEYIVATALDIDEKTSRANWYEYDLLYGNTRIEVKSSAYLQSWEREGLSRISFTIYPARPTTASIWDSDDISRHSDIYVFCLFKSKDRETANPMMLEQWDFYVVKTDDINNHLGKQRTVSISTITSLPHIKCSYNELRQSVDSVAIK